MVRYLFKLNRELLDLQAMEILFPEKLCCGERGHRSEKCGKLKGLFGDVMIRNKRSNVDVMFTKRTAYTHTIDIPDREKALYDDLSTYIRNNYERQDSVLNRFRLKNLQEQIGSTITAVIPSLETLVMNEKLSSFDRKVLGRYLDEARATVADGDSGHKKANEVADILQRFDGKMIVFTKIASTQRYLSDFLKKRGISGC